MIIIEGSEMDTMNNKSCFIFLGKICMDEPDAPCLELAEGNYCASYGDICRNSCHPDCMRELYF